MAASVAMMESNEPVRSRSLLCSSVTNHLDHLDFSVESFDLFLTKVFVHDGISEFNFFDTAVYLKLVFYRNHKYDCVL